MGDRLGEFERNVAFVEAWQSVYEDVFSSIRLWTLSAALSRPKFNRGVYQSGILSGMHCWLTFHYAGQLRNTDYVGSSPVV